MSENWYSGIGSFVSGFFARKIKAENITTSEYTLQELSNLYSVNSSYSGAAVTERGSLTISAVYACVALIAGAISNLPLHIYKRTEEGRERSDHVYWWLFNERPNSNMSAAVFWEYLASCVLMLGDGFAQIIRPNPYTSVISGLMPIHPSRVQVLDAKDGSLLYQITPTTGAQYTVRGEDMLHIPGLGFDGKRGVSVVTFAARQGIGTALAAEEFSARFFSNGARPDFLIEVPGNLSADAQANLKKYFTDRHQGASNAHLPGVLTNGAKIERLTMSAEDSQLISTRGFQVEDICRFFGVPPFMVGHMEKTTSWGAGVENMGRGFSKFTLARHLCKFEQEINHKFWPNRERYFVEFNLAGLERGDLKSENEALRVALGRAGEPGWMTVNEVRRIKNLPPIEGGNSIATAQAPAEATAEDSPDTQDTQNEQDEEPNQA